MRNRLAGTSQQQRPSPAAPETQRDLMALGLTCSGTKKGRERRGRDRKR